MVRLHYLGGTDHTDLPADVVADLKKLLRVPRDTFVLLSGVTLELLGGDSTSRSKATETIEGLTGEGGFSVGDVKSALRALTYVYESAWKRSCSVDQLLQDWQTMGVPEEEVLNQLGEQWTDATRNMARAAVDTTLSVQRLLDMDWRFGVTVGTSELEGAGRSFLQLKLVLDDRDDPVFVEMSLPEFYRFLHEMERAKAALSLYG